jgi:hypothetical protein
MGAHKKKITETEKSLGREKSAVGKRLNIQMPEEGIINILGFIKVQSCVPDSCLKR